MAVRKTVAWILAAVLIAVLAVVMLDDRGSPAGGRDAGDAGVVLNRGVGPEPDTMDPQRAKTVQAYTVLNDLFEGLLRYSPSGELVAGVAERWEISDDGLEYRFWLRADARWSSGEPVTADDFVYSLRRLVDPATAAFNAKLIAPVLNAEAIVGGELPPDKLGVEAVGRLEFTVKLERPTPYFLSLLTQPPTFPVSRASVDEHGDAFTRPGKLVSNGAYLLHEWTLASVLESRRNDQYWDNARTAIDVVRYFVTPEPSNELYRYLAGELDITWTVPSEAFPRLRQERPNELRIAPQLGIYYYGMNLNHPELGSKPDLREALSLAMDRNALVEKVVGRGEQPAYSFVPPGVHNHESPQLSFADKDKADRHAQARRLYEQAGYGPKNPLEIELRYNTSETHERIAIAIQEMWREVLGFEAVLINEEFRVLIENVRAMEITEIFRLNWTGDYNDAHAFLSIFESDSPSNMFAYRNEEFDSLLEQAAAQTDPLRRRRYLEEAERVLLADHVVIPIYYYISKHLVSPKVRGWQDNVLDYHYSQHLDIDAGR